MSSKSLRDRLDSFIEPLNEQVHELQHWLQSRNLDVTDENVEGLESIDELLRSLETTVSDLDACVTKEEESIVYMERLHEALNLQRKRINFLSNGCDNLQLPQLTKPQHVQPSQALQSIIQSNYAANTNNNSATNDMKSFIINTNDCYQNCAAWNDLGAENAYNKMKNNNCNNNNSRSLSSGASTGFGSNHGHSNGSYGSKNQRTQITAMVDGQVRKKRRLNNGTHSSESLGAHGTNGTHGNGVSQIVLIGKDEFEGVPKYVKSRLTQERINNAIEDFNSELKKKYKIMTLNPNKLSSHQFELYDRYQKQESSETKGYCFLAEEDLKGSQYFTKDQTGKAIMNVLRHIKRVKMIGGKHTKYIVYP